MNMKFTKGQSIKVTLGGITVPGFVNGFQEGFGSKPGFWLVTIREKLSEVFIANGTFTPGKLEAAGATIEAI